MSSAGAATGHAASLQVPAPEVVRAELERVLASPDLEASERRRAFLRYIVEETLAGRADRLKGYSIAIAVFHRDEGFDGQADPVVRLEARRLRRDLDSYYMSAGSRDPVRISIPKGSYVPRFDWFEPGGGPTPGEHPEPDDPPLREALPAERPASAGTPGGDEKANEGPQRAGRAGVPPAVFAAAVLVIVVLAGVVGWLVLRGETSPVEGGVAEPSLVVMPFAAMGTLDDGAYLAAGIGQQLVDDLLRFPGFRVYALPGLAAPPEAAELARNVGVTYVVTGSVSGTADMVRVGAQLRDADTGRVIWSATYDRPYAPGALIETQDEIAGEIATVVGQPYGAVGNDLEERTHTPRVANMQSYVCVLRAFTYRRTFAAAAFDEVLPCLEEAVRRDPGYGDAWAMLAWLHLDAARFGHAGRDDAAVEYREALGAANHALRLDPTNAIAVQAAAATNHYMGRYEESERLARRAVALNPHDPDSLAQLGWRLAVRGKFEEGIPLLEQAISRTVNPPGWYYHLIAVDLYLKGAYEEMLDMAERSGNDGSGMSQAFIAIAAGAVGDAARARVALAAMDGLRQFADGPAAAFRLHGATDEIVAALVAGIEEARAVASGS